MPKQALRPVADTVEDYLAIRGGDARLLHDHRTVPAASPHPKGEAFIAEARAVLRALSDGASRRR